MEWLQTTSCFRMTLNTSNSKHSKVKALPTCKVFKNTQTLWLGNTKDSKIFFFIFSASKGQVKQLCKYLLIPNPPLYLSLGRNGKQKSTQHAQTHHAELLSSGSGCHEPAPWSPHGEMSMGVQLGLCPSSGHPRVLAVPACRQQGTNQGCIPSLLKAFGAECSPGECKSHVCFGFGGLFFPY